MMGLGAPATPQPVALGARRGVRRLAGRQMVKRQRYLIAVEVDLEHTVDVTKCLRSRANLGSAARFSLVVDRAL